MTILQSPASPENYTSGRAYPEITHVAIHIAEGSLAGTLAWFATPAAEVSAHYVIGKDGSVHQCVQEHDTAWAVGLPAPFRWADTTKDPHRNYNPNSFTISIEHEGRIEDAPPWPDAQIQASAALVADICRRYRIPAIRQFVVRHSEIGGHPQCPGANCPIDQIVAMAFVLIDPSPASKLEQT